MTIVPGLWRISAGIFLLAAAVACSPQQPEKTAAPAAEPKAPAQAPAGNPPAPAFSSVLPTIRGTWVEGQKADFIFPIPPGWRVVPMDDALWKQQMAAGFEEILLRPDISLKPTPYIRVRRMLGQSFKYQLFKGDEQGAARHMLLQFVGGKNDPKVLDEPLLDTEQGRMSFHFSTQKFPGQVNAATFYYLPGFTVMIQGTFADADAEKQQKAAYDFVNAGFKVHSTP